MKLSVVIVNYNVIYFLDQCIRSALQSAEHARKMNPDYEVDIYVVDNNSVDGSVEMVREKYPDVKLIANRDNVGFSKANNQAMRESQAEYVLLLNPDTLVEEDTFYKSIQFMDEHPDAGGLGVKMVDGKGKFLRESKRGLPTPWVAFYKIFGLSALFPKSRIFSKYHLGYLDENETHQVEILAGAYMMMRKSVLDQIGLLDEDYFMYGEDIDLSYRITQAGYKNYYFPGTRIIHYKGESTKKSSINYVLVFYNAMIIFARKHFSTGNARVFSFLINLAIYLRAGVAILHRLIKSITIPLIDFVLLYAGMYYQMVYWENNHRYVEGGEYPLIYSTVFIPIYIAIWQLSVFLNGGYDKPVRIIEILRGVVIGTIVILAGYSLLPEDLRNSRALILLGAVWAAFALPGLRLFLKSMGLAQFSMGNRIKRILIVGEREEALRVVELLRKVQSDFEFIGYVSEQRDEEPLNIGTIHQLQEIRDIYKADEIIFCARNIQTAEIISCLSQLNDENIEFKIAPEDTDFVIGSNTINSPDQIYTLNLNALNRNPDRRNRRLMNLFICLLFVPMLPILVVINHPVYFLKNWISVFRGRKSWVGFTPLRVQTTIHYPGVLYTSDNLPLRKNLPDDFIGKINLQYARDFSVWNDFVLVFSHLGRLDRHFNPTG